MANGGRQGRSVYLWGAAFFLGVIAILGQITLLRESLILVGGDELSLGITLGIWTLAVGLGSIIAGRWFKPGNAAFAVSLAVLPVAYLTSLYLIWSARDWMGVGFGEIVGVFRALPYLLISLSPLPLVGGIAFALAANNRPRREAIGIYVAEGLGSGVAGLAFAFALGPLLTPLGLCYVLAPAAIVGLILLTVGSATRTRIVAILGGVSLIAAIVIFAANYGAIRSKWFERKVFVGYEVTELSQTRYGAVAVLEREGQVSLFANGQLIASFPDREGAEEAVHFPLAAHPGPEKVALLGGGLNGEIREIYKHPSVKSVDFVRLDKELLEIAERADANAGIESRDGLNIYYDDPRAWAGKQVGDGELYDVVIVQAPEPLSAGVNRFYTADFFAQVKRLLAPGGIMGFNTMSSENYYSEEMGQYLRSVASTCGDVFEDVVVLPTGGITFICSDTPIEGYYGSYYDDVFGERGLDNKYYRGATLINDYSEDAGSVAEDLGITGRPSGIGNVRVITTKPGNIKDILTDDRIDGLNEIVAEPGTVNRDIKPTSYYFAGVLWAGRADDWGKSFLDAAGHLRLWHIIAALSLFVVLWIIIAKRNPVWRGRAVAIAVFAQGFAEISFLILILLGFSSVYGAAYNALAPVIAVFMLGLCGGAVWSELYRVKDARQTLTDILVYAVVTSFVVTLAIYVFGRWAGVLPVALGYAAFLALSAGTGFLGGAQFPLAMRLMERDNANNVPGRLYGFDLIGSALGAAVMAAVVVPILGLAQGALAIAAVLSAAMIIMSTTGKYDLPGIND